MSEINILLCNDDGYDAPGILALARAMRGLGRLHICAPLHNQSGVGSALTGGRRFAVHPQSPTEDGVPRLAVAGTPVDAMQYGLKIWLAGTPPDLVLSGINQGANIGTNVRASGTLGAAFEAAWRGFPALAVSMDYREPPVCDAACHYARQVAEYMLAAGKGQLPAVLNLNAPALPVAEAKGLRLAGMGTGGYVDFFIDPAKVEAPYAAIKSAMERNDPPDAALDGALLHTGYASLTPLSLDWTDHECLRRLREAMPF